MIERSIYPSLKEHLQARQISVLIGPRQVGKTTLVRKLQRELQEEGRSTMYLNLDVENDARLLVSQQTFLQRIKLEFGEREGVVFIDEIQRKPDAGRFLKGLYDQDLPYKFVVTGSGSLDLRASVSESLAGRKRVFPIQTISFREFFNYRTDYKYRDRETAYATLESEKMDLLLWEYISYGGYPEVVLASTIAEKRAVMSELFSAYVEKDIVNLLNIEQREGFILLLRLIADRQGGPINITKLSNDANLSRDTIKKYLYFAEQTFVIHRLSPFFNNTGKELTKAPEYYFTDIGLRNFAHGRFTLLNAQSARAGQAFEHFIFIELERHARENGYKLQYWRTSDQLEVDFIVNRHHNVVPVEAKLTQSVSSATRGMKSFQRRYACNEAFVVSRNTERRSIPSTPNLAVVPWWEFSFGYPL